MNERYIARINADKVKLNNLSCDGRLYYLDNASINEVDRYDKIGGLVIDSKNGLDSTQIQRVIDKYPNIEKLVIQGQDYLKYLDVSKLANLKYLEIKNNDNLFKIIGLDRLTNLKEFIFCDNVKYYDNNKFEQRELCSAVSKLCSNGTRVNLDVRYMYIMQEFGINFPDGIRWYEESVLVKGYQSGDKRNYNYYEVEKIQYTSLEMYEAMQNAKKIVDRYIRKEDTNEQKIAIIYQWIRENITYDKEGLNNEDGRYVDQYGRSCGVKHGTKGTVNGLVYGSCICYGYVRMMQLMLKMCKINSTSVSCFIDTEEYSVKDIVDDIAMSVKYGNHAILRINNLDSLDYYIDITADAKLFRDNKPPRYFMLSKESIINNRKSAIDGKPVACKLILEDGINSGLDFSNEKVQNLLEYAQDRIRNVDIKIENDKTKNKTLQEKLSNIIFRLDDLKYKYKIVNGQLNDLEKKVKCEIYETDILLEYDGYAIKKRDFEDLNILRNQKLSLERRIDNVKSDYKMICRQIIDYMARTEGYSMNFMKKTLDDLQEEKSVIIFKLSSLLEKNQITLDTYNDFLTLVEKRYTPHGDKKK